MANLVGRPYNPLEHEATEWVETVEFDRLKKRGIGSVHLGETGTILKVVDDGYFIGGGHVLKRAKVEVLRIGTGHGPMKIPEGPDISDTVD
uniref:Uncharacterized protein n=1 Tax=Lotharella globosa TaxID=91324 RepID=A0A7S3ZDQ3_9EUKA